MNTVDGRIIAYDGSKLTIQAPFTDTEWFIKKRYNLVRVELMDGRTITPDQRKKAHALMNEISEWAGYAPDTIKRLMKIEFMAGHMRDVGEQLLSLADCGMDVAREFITFLIDFAVDNNIPTKIPLFRCAMMWNDMCTRA